MRGAGRAAPLSRELPAAAATAGPAGDTSAMGCGGHCLRGVLVTFHPGSGVVIALHPVGSRGVLVTFHSWGAGDTAPMGCWSHFTPGDHTSPLSC